MRSVWRNAMKMPFGKFKGKDVHKLDFDYIDWLDSISLRSPLKEVVDLIVNSDKFKTYKSSQRSISESAQQTYSNQKIDYSKDISFWSKASPYSVWREVRNGNIELTYEQHKKLCDITYELEK